jgi:thiamine kinase-like enzyme
MIATEEPPLCQALRLALRGHPAWAHAPLEPLPDKGLAHFHIRLAGTGVLARIPKQSQVGLPPELNLRHQQACFERAGASGHTPRLLGVLPASAHLPRGALLVTEILGRPAALPADLQAIAQALAALHALPLPPAAARAPLGDGPDPLRDLLAEVLAQAQHAAAARLEAESQRLLDAELDALRQLVQRPDRPQRRFIAFDAHPGNFLLRAAGDAVLVDLEKCRYSYPGLDLAHTTLYTSTTWDAAAQAVLSLEQVAGFYANWEHTAGPAIAAVVRPWHVPLRQSMWLWSLTWCCKWRALADQPARDPEAGEDWSAEHSDAALVRHVRERVDHYLSPAVIVRVRDELRGLQRAFAE